MPNYDAEELDRFWDALVAGHAPDPTALDPLQAETIRAFHAAEDVPGADTAFINRLKAELLPLGTTVERFAGSPEGRPSLNGSSPQQRSASPPVRFETRHGPRRFLRWAAVLLLVVMGFGLLTERLDRSEPRNTIPAATGSPRSDGTVLEVTLAADELPTSYGGVLSGGLTDVTIEPGVTSNWYGKCCPGVRVNFILEGKLTMRPGAPMGIVRAGSDGGVETIAAGAEVILGPGDAFIAQNAAPFETINAGSAVVRFLMIDLTTQENSVAPGWVLSAFSGAIDAPVQPGPITLRLKRTSFGPSEATPTLPANAYALMALTYERNAAGTPESAALTSEGGAAVLNPPFTETTATTTVYILTFEPPAGMAGTPVAESPTP